MKPVTNVLLPLYLVVKYLKSVLILFNLDAIQQSLEEFIYQDCNKQNKLFSKSYLQRRSFCQRKSRAFELMR